LNLLILPTSCLNIPILLNPSPSFPNLLTSLLSRHCPTGLL
jgi:hypothetical protein